MSHPEPTVLERLAAAGLNPELLAQLRGRHRRRTPCHCSACEARPEATSPAPALESDDVATRYLALTSEGSTT